MKIPHQSSGIRAGASPVLTQSQVVPSIFNNVEIGYSQFEAALIGKSVDCDEFVRKAALAGRLNGAAIGCARAICESINCAVFDDCTMSRSEHNQSVRYFCDLLAQD